MFNLCLFLTLLAPAVLAQSTGCNISHVLKPGVTHLKSPNYPGNYSAGSTCKYKYTAPPNHYIRVNCTLRLPSNNGQNKDKFILASEGDSRMSSAQNYYGYRSVSPEPFYKNLVLGYISNGIRGGSFMCVLRTSRQNCQCGRSIPQSRISNGEKARPGDFPSMVALKDGRNFKKRPFCGGTIVTSKYILTARTCLAYVEDASNIVVTAGTTSLWFPSSSRWYRQFWIKRKLGNDNYDIAILETKTEMVWTEFIRPACLPPIDLNDTFANEKVDLVGFGTSTNGEPRDELHTVRHQVADDAVCDANRTNLVSRPMCTFDYSGNKRDTCKFDSGGPVYLQKSRMFLIGVIWNPKDCGKKPNAMRPSIRVLSEMYHILWRINFTNCVVKFK